MKSNGTRKGAVEQLAVVLVLVVVLVVALVLLVVLILAAVLVVVLIVHRACPPFRNWYTGSISRPAVFMRRMRKKFLGGERLRIYSKIVDDFWVRTEYNTFITP